MMQNSLSLICFEVNDYLKVLTVGEHKGTASALIVLLTEQLLLLCDNLEVMEKM